jgi:hypothetical protein
VSRTTPILRAALTESQYAEYREAARLDSRDSEARKRWRYVRDKIRSAPIHRAWLLKHGYIDSDGRWLDVCKL